MINIGLVNEMALMCDRMGGNIWEVIETAATKPFGFTPVWRKLLFPAGKFNSRRTHAFLSGAGLGRALHTYRFLLSWKTKQAGIEARFIELAGYINGQMPHFVVDKIQHALNDHRKPLNGSRVHILGVAYKREINNVRESPALDIIHLLERRGAEVTYSDPYIPLVRIDDKELFFQRSQRDRPRGSGLRRHHNRSRVDRLCGRCGKGSADCRHAQCPEAVLVFKNRSGIKPGLSLPIAN